MKMRLLIVFALILFSCKKESKNGCLYEAPKTNYVERIKLIGNASYSDYQEKEKSGNYGKLFWVKSTGCDCPEYLN